jgi:DMSO/TMAO reductase YedYZ molybdopterin-dependent catalytic subunit
MNDRSYGGTRSRAFAGAGVGVIATGAGLAVAEVIVGIIRNTSSPVIAVGQKVIDLVPPSLKNWAIETFGTNDKTVLIVTTLAILLVTGAVIGTIAIGGRLFAALVGAAMIGVIGIAAVATRPDPTTGKMAPIVAGTIVSMLVLWWLTPRYRTSAVASPHAVATVGDTDQTSPIEPRSVVLPRPGAADRRSFLLRGIGVASLAAVGGGAGRLIQRRHSVSGERAALSLPSAAGRRPAAALPPNADLDVEGLSSFVTSNDDFYRIDTALTVPQVSKDDWRLRIHGMVDNELELTFDDLLAREQIEAYVTLACVSNPIGGPYVGNALWQGVRLDALLAEVGVDPASTQLLSTSIDGWTCGTPVSSLIDGRNAMLAIAMNGEPLPPDHGYPVRMVVPGEYGYVSATKWVVDMEFTTWEDAEAFWVPRGWAQQAPMKSMTRIEAPRHKATVPAGPLEIAGTAYAVHRGIAAVEVRIDEGEWIRAELGGVPSPDTWRKWLVEWDAEPGEHTIEARATDGLGQVQTEEVTDVAPDGASGYDATPIPVV